MEFGRFYSESDKSIGIMDQATTLREILKGKRIEITDTAQSSGNVFLITSGKGGVGKSMLATNLAVAAGTTSSPSLLIDANTQGAHLDFMLNADPKYRLNEVISGDVSIIEAIDHSLENVHLLAGIEDIPFNNNYSYDLRKRILDNFELIRSIYSSVIIDVDSTQLENIEWFTKVCSSVVLVTTLEVTSITDTYALVKYLISKIGRTFTVKIIVNRSKKGIESKEIFRRLNLMTENFLDMKISYAGSVPFMKSIERSITDQSPVALNNNSPGLSKLFKSIIKEIHAEEKKTLMNQIYESPLAEQVSN